MLAGDAPFLPVFQLESTDGLVSSPGGEVSEWQDQSGSGNHLFALTGEQPLSGVTQTPTGLDAIRFDGADDRLIRGLDDGPITGLPDGNESRTVFLVAQFHDASAMGGATYGRFGNQRAFGVGVAGPGDDEGDITLQTWGVGNDLISDESAYDAGGTSGWMVISAVHEDDGTDPADNGFLYRDGVEIASWSEKINTKLNVSTTLHGKAKSRIVLGEEIRELGHQEMDIAAWLVYDGALSDSDRGQVEAYLTAKYLDSAIGETPVAIDDRVRLDDGATLAIDVLTNDADPDGALDLSSVTIVTPPTHAASFSVDPLSGVVTYEHDGGGSPDSFTYTVRDAAGGLSNEATVHVAVNSEALSLDGFGVETVFSTAADGILQPIAVDFLPDGRMLILQKDGVIWIADPNSGEKSEYLRLTNIDFGTEKGLLDVTISPDFDPDAPGEDYVYLYYTPASPRRAMIARFTHQENAGGLTSTLDLASEFEVWRDTDGYITCCHYGGGLDFGPDGKLWLTVSDKFTAPNPGEGGNTENHPQDLTKAGGSVIRVNPDGTAPDGTDGWAANPFIDPVDDDPNLPGAQDYHDFIWGYGLRNPFRASWDLPTGRFYMGEVGGNVQSFSYEDVHVATLDEPGVNYGWPNHEGPGLLAFGDPILHSTPIYSYAHDGAGASITGGEVYRGSQFPAEWDGVYFVGDFTRDTIRYLRFDEEGNVTGDFDFKPTTQLPGAADQIVHLTIGPDGALYFTLIGGRVRRIQHDSRNEAPSIESMTVDPATGGAPLGVDFSALISDPEGDALTYEWRFGDGQSMSGVVTGGEIDIDHTYFAEGVYQSNLEVSDGQTVVYSEVVTVSVGSFNLAPVISSFAADPITGDLPLEVDFTAEVSDPDGDTMTYEVLYGDGQTSGVLPVPASGMITHTRTYTEAGSFNARLRISDGAVTTESDIVNIGAGETQLPPVTDGLVVLLESDIKVSVSTGDTVAAWLDGSGQGNNLDAFGDPQIVFDATPGGLPAIVFDGDGDKLERLNTAVLNNLPGGNTDRTVFTVVDYVNSNGVTAGFVYGRDRTNRAFGLTTDAAGELTVQGWGLANDFESGVVGLGAGWLTQSVVLSSGEVDHFSNGALIDSYSHDYNTILSAADSKIVIGEEISGLGFTEMAIAAALVYDRALTDTERQQVEDYLQAKYFAGNFPPTAGDDTALVATGAAVSIDLLANDSDSDGVLNPATVVVVDQPTSGTVSIDPLTGVATYTHDGGASLSDTFTYQVSDEVNNASNTATVTVTVQPPQTSSESQTIVRWHGDYYQYLWENGVPGGAPSEIRENRWLRGGPQAGAQLSQQGLDLDQDGQFDDSVVYFDFSLTEPLNPLTTTPKPNGYVYHADMPSGQFYGGLSASYYNYETDRVQQAFIENDGAGGDLAYVGYEPSPYIEPEFQGLQDYVELVRNDDGRYRKTHVGPHEDFAINLYRPDLPHPIDPADDPADNLLTFDAAFIWKKEDFLGGGAGQRVSLDPGSFFSFESTRWWDSVGEARWILQDDDQQLYISQFAVAGQQDNWGHTNRFDDPLSSQWAVYTPTGSDLAFDPSTATWIDPVAAGLFDDIQAAGIHISQPTPTGDLTKFSLDEITFNAVVGEPTGSNDPTPVTAGLVVDLNASAGVVTDGQGGVVGWLDSSGNGNDLQTAIGSGELLTDATPSGEEAIRLTGGDSLQRDGSIDPLNGLATGSADRTLFFVVSYADASGMGGFGYGGSGANEGFGLGVDGATDNQALLIGAGGIVSSEPGVGAGWVVQSVVLSGDTYSLYSDGVLIDSGFASLSTTGDLLSIGGGLDGSGHADLDVAAALAYDRALSELERHELQAYLHNRYLSP